MAITLVVAAYQSTTANTYVSLEDSEIYHERRLHNPEWLAATDEQKRAALVWATRSLDSWMSWIGYRSWDEQSLEWPRVNAYDRSGYAYEHTDIPQPLKDATSELAYLLLKSDRSAESSNPSSAGLSSVTVGDISLVFDPKDRIEEVPDSVAVLLRGLGAKASPKPSAVKLQRV